MIIVPFIVKQDVEQNCQVQLRAIIVSVCVKFVFFSNQAMTSTTMTIVNASSRSIVATRFSRLNPHSHKYYQKEMDENKKLFLSKKKTRAKNFIRTDNLEKRTNNRSKMFLKINRRTNLYSFLFTTVTRKRIYLAKTKNNNYIKTFIGRQNTKESFLLEQIKSY